MSGASVLHFMLQGGWRRRRASPDSHMRAWRTICGTSWSYRRWFCAWRRWGTRGKRFLNVRPRVAAPRSLLSASGLRMSRDSFPTMSVHCKSTQASALDQLVRYARAWMWKYRISGAVLLIFSHTIIMYVTGFCFVSGLSWMCHMTGVLQEYCEWDLLWGQGGDVLTHTILTVTVSEAHLTKQMCMAWYWFTLQTVLMVNFAFVEQFVDFQSYLP